MPKKGETLYEERIGKIFITNQGYTVKIIDYEGVEDLKIEFEDGLVLEKISYSSLKKGKVGNPLHPTVFGVGYIGIGQFKCIEDINRKINKCFSVWRSMLSRCYSKNYQNNQPTYLECTVIEDWHNFQSFAEWFYQNYRETFALDKDILVKGNKVYSPETCCFVPREINNLFIKRKVTKNNLLMGVRKSGVKFCSLVRKGKEDLYLGTYNTEVEAFEAYKIAKEIYIKEKANEWKDRVDKKVYEAMYNWVVEITD